MMVYRNKQFKYIMNCLFFILIYRFENMHKFVNHFIESRVNSDKLQVLDKFSQEGWSELTIDD